MRIWTKDNPKHPLRYQANLLVHTIDFARLIWISKSKPGLFKRIHKACGGV